ncbi:uncharacterized protein LOC144712490 [Wolffia australiana]
MILLQGARGRPSFLFLSIDGAPGGGTYVAPKRAGIVSGSNSLECPQVGPTILADHEGELTIVLSGQPIGKGASSFGEGDPMASYPSSPVLLQFPSSLRTVRLTRVPPPPAPAHDLRILIPTGKPGCLPYHSPLAGLLRLTSETTPSELPRAENARICNRSLVFFARRTTTPSDQLAIWPRHNTLWFPPPPPLLELIPRTPAIGDRFFSCPSDVRAVRPTVLQVARRACSGYQFPSPLSWGGFRAFLPPDVRRRLTFDRVPCHLPGAVPSRLRSSPRLGSLLLETPCSQDSHLPP